MDDPAVKALGRETVIAFFYEKVDTIIDGPVYKRLEAKYGPDIMDQFLTHVMYQAIPFEMIFQEVYELSLTSKVLPITTNADSEEFNHYLCRYWYKYRGKYYGINDERLLLGIFKAITRAIQERALDDVSAETQKQEKERLF